jgi:hypothetical protein
VKLWIATTAVYAAFVAAFAVAFGANAYMALFVVAAGVGYLAGAVPLWRAWTHAVPLVVGGMVAIALGNLLGMLTWGFGVPLTVILVVIGYLDLRRAAKVSGAWARAMLVIVVPLVAFVVGFTLFDVTAAAVAAVLALLVVSEVAPRRHGRTS